MARITPLPRAEASPKIQETYDRIFGEGRDPVAQPGSATGTPGDWWTAWAREPGILSAFSAYTGSTVDQKLLQLAITRTGYACQSTFVYSQHCKAARVFEVEEAKIAAIPYWSVSDVYTPNERAVLAYADAMCFENGRVHDKLFETLKSFHSDEQLLMLTYSINMYRLHASATRALKLEYDNVPDRIVEVPAPATKGSVQDWPGRTEETPRPRKRAQPA